MFDVVLISYSYSFIIGLIIWIITNRIVIRSGCYLDHVFLRFYVILLPRKEDSSLSSLLNTSLDDLKQILLCCGLIHCQRDTLKLDLNGWPTLMMENHIDQYYFDKFSVTRLNWEKTYFIGIGTKRSYKLTPSSQFLSDSCPRKSSSLSKKIKKEL